MQVDLTQIDRTRFHVDERETPFGRLTLVTPKGKIEWKPGEEWFRSAMFNEEGVLVSVGFPKFFNYGAVPTKDQEFDALLADPDTRIRWRPKYDGTLIIASPYKDSVLWRTREGFDLGQYRERAEALIPTVRLRFARGESYLFEYTGPKNRQVIRYRHERLVPLGVVERWPAVPRYFDLCADDEVPYPVSTHTAAEVRRALENWSIADGEGLVASCYNPHALGCRFLVKFKTPAYYRYKEIQTHLTREKVWAWLLAHGVTSYFEAADLTEKYGYPFGFATYLSEIIEEYLSALEDHDDICLGIRIGLNRQPPVPPGSRAACANAAKQACAAAGHPEYFPWALAVATGDTENEQNMYAQLLLGISRQQVQELVNKDRKLLPEDFVFPKTSNVVDIAK